MREKKCRTCGKPRGHELMYSRCKQCQYDFVASKPKKHYELKKTKPKLVGVKRIKRIKKDGSEMKVFIEIWQEREHICENCNKPIKLFHSSCFAHKLNKRDNPELRYDKNNIALVHGIWEQKNDKGQTYDCHKEFDKKFNELKKLGDIK